MPNLVARHAFRDLAGLLRRANRGTDATAFARLLREAGKQHPDGRTIQLIVYRSKLVKSNLAESMLDAFSKVLAKNGAISTPLSLSDNVLEFDSYLPGLGSVMSVRERVALHPENDPEGALAVAVGLQPYVIREMSRGTNRLVPHEMAVRVAMAAQGVLHLPAPPDVVRVSANDRTLKPLGAESGKEPHKCDDSVRLRREVLSRCQQIDRTSDRVAAQ